MQETAARLSSICRTLTAERGIAGFTIEEVCERADVSRRTFFNYFPSKEDAILGIDPEESLQQFAANFIARGSGGWPKVVDDLVELAIEHFETAGVDHGSHAEFLAVIEKEPRLLLRFIGAARDRDRRAIAFVAAREGVSADDPRAEAAVTLLSTMLRTAGERMIDPANTDTFGTLLHDHLDAFRAVLAAPSTREAQS